MNVQQQAQEKRYLIEFLSNFLKEELDRVSGDLGSLKILGSEDRALERRATDRLISFFENLINITLRTLSVFHYKGSASDAVQVYVTVFAQKRFVEQLLLILDLNTVNLSLLPIWLHCLHWISEDDSLDCENAVRNKENREWIILQINSVIKSCLSQSFGAAPETKPELKQRIEDSVTHVFLKVLNSSFSDKLAFDCKELAEYYRLDKLSTKITEIQNRILAENRQRQYDSRNGQFQLGARAGPTKFSPTTDLSRSNTAQSAKQDNSLFKIRSKQQPPAGSSLIFKQRNETPSSVVLEEVSCLRTEPIDTSSKFQTDSSHRKEAFFEMFIKTKSIKKPTQLSKQDIETSSRKELRIDSTDLSLKEAAKKNLEHDKRNGSPNCRILSLRPQRKIIKIAKPQTKKTIHTEKIKKNKQQKTKKTSANRRCSFDDLQLHKAQSSKRANKKPSEVSESHFIGPQFFDHLSIECRSEDLNLFKTEKPTPASFEKPAPVANRRHKVEPHNIHLSPPRARRSFEELQSKQIDDWMEQIVAMGTPSRSSSPLGFNDRRSADGHQ